MALYQLVIVVYISCSVISSVTMYFVMKSDGEQEFECEETASFRVTLLFVAALLGPIMLLILVVALIVNHIERQRLKSKE